MIQESKTVIVSSTNTTRKLVTSSKTTRASNTQPRFRNNKLSWRGESMKSDLLSNSNSSRMNAGTVISSTTGNFPDDDIEAAKNHTNASIPSLRRLQPRQASPTPPSSQEDTKKKQLPKRILFLRRQILMLSVIFICGLITLLALLSPSSIASPSKSSQEFTNNTAVGLPKTTIVLMGYSPKRQPNYDIILPAYGDMPDIIDQVLFLWNNPNVPAPTVPTNTAVPILSLPQKRNDMNNRFGRDVTANTRTSSILLLDDDVLLSHDMIVRMVRKWHVDGNQVPMVGIINDGRIADKSKGYLYPCPTKWFEGWYMQTFCWTHYFQPKEVQRMPNLVIGKTMLFATEYVTKYQNLTHVIKYVQDGHFCEDIFMNAMVQQLTEVEPLFVKQDTTRGWRFPKWMPLVSSADTVPKNVAIRNILYESDGLSLQMGWARVFSWSTERSECVQWAAEQFHPVWGK